MPRRSGVPKRDVLPDPIYNDKVVTKLVNQIMMDGKKGTAESIVYGAFPIVDEKTGTNPLEVFKKALLENVAERKRHYHFNLPPINDIFCKMRISRPA